MISILIASISAWLLLVIYSWCLKKHSNEIKQLQLSNKKLVADINTLHKNQSVITSSIRDLHRMIKKYDKGAKRKIQLDKEESQ